MAVYPVVERLPELSVVEVARLREGLSPRARGTDADHVARLTEVFDQLPPIVVHASTNLVIDGAHRLAAARAIGRSTITAVLFHGSEEEAVVEAVRLNVAHGKPLTSHERGTALWRLVTQFPEWSDRRLAEVCGVSTKRVATTRRALGDTSLSESRVGRDNRVRRPRGQARARAAEVVADDPSATTRELARRAAVSEATIRAARQKRPSVPIDRHDSTTLDVRDQALESAGATAFVEWLKRTEVTNEWQDLLADVPLGRIYDLADEARRRAELWAGVARALEELSRRR